MKYSHKFKGKDQYKNKQDNLLEPTRMYLYGNYFKLKHKYKTFEDYCKIIYII